MHALRPSGPVSDAAWHPQLLSRLWTASYQLAKSLTAWNYNMAGHRFDMRGSIAVQCLGHIYYIWWAVGYRRINYHCSSGALSCLYGCIILCRVNRVLSS